MRYRRSRIPGTGPVGPPALVVRVESGTGLQVNRAGRVRGGEDARKIDTCLRHAGTALQPLFPGMGEGPLADFYRVDWSTSGPQGLPADSVGLNAALRGIGAVSAAYIRPHAVLPVFLSGEVENEELAAHDAAGPTPDLSAQQGYLGPARQGGIDARYAWTIPGGRGAGVTVIDIEQAWNAGHEDLGLTADDIVAGRPISDIESRNHGTSVVGMLGAAHNRIGIMGICPEADVKGISIRGTRGWDVAPAIRAAAERLAPGDIMLLELMVQGPEAPDYPTRDSQVGYIPAEWWPAEFAAIKWAVDKGIIVVEAAGNGAIDLDAPIYDTTPRAFGASWRNPFRDENDSGAIIVGAGAPPGSSHGADLSRLAFSNWGERVDVQGWGVDVVTSGGHGAGPGMFADRPESQWYTRSFSGTSSAAPMVAGALACVQGILRQEGPRLLRPEEARELLWKTGVPQASDGDRLKTQKIGSRPDLPTLIARARELVRKRPPTVPAPDPPEQTDPEPQPTGAPSMATNILITVLSTDDQIGGAGNDRDALIQMLLQAVVNPQWKGPTIALPAATDEVQEMPLVEVLRRATDT